VVDSYMPFRKGVGGRHLCAPSGRGLVVGSYMPFRKGVGARQFCAFLVGV
jgi:hypothetical protein